MEPEGDEHPRGSYALFDGHLSMPFVPGEPPRFQQIVDNNAEVSEFLRKALLYERLVIPTVDMTAVPLLAAWIGLPALVAALHQKDIQLARYKGSIGYVGNGNGLELFEIRAPDEGGGMRQQGGAGVDLPWCEADEALAIIGPWFEQYFSKNEWIDLTRAALDNLLAVESSEFTPVAEATYREVMENPVLETFFAQRNHNLKKLTGVANNALRYFRTPVLDDIDLLLHMAQLNFETYLASRAGAIDQTTSPVGERVANFRMQVRATGADQNAAFTKILTLAKVPDLAGIVDQDEHVDTIWKLRGSRSTREFRRWFHENVRDHPEEAESAFVETLLQTKVADKLPTKALRWAVTTGIGVAAAVAGAPLLALGAIGAVISNAIGPAASAVDALTGDRLLRRGHDPKLLIDDLKKQLHE